MHGVAFLTRSLRVVALAVALAGGTARAARAQDDQAAARAWTRRTVAAADSLLRAGRVASAEASYYAAARRQPREPMARLALGRYLAARGALRIGAVLLEEARDFGASPDAVALYLAPVYARLEDWRALAALRPSPLSGPERARAEWLAARGTSVAGPDSVAVPITRTADGRWGVVLRVGDDSMVAAIDADVRGVVLDLSREGAAGVRRFADDPGGAAAGVAERAAIGGLAFTNLPVSLAPLGGGARARIGPDVLARLAATVDPGRRRLVLRRAGRVEIAADAARYPLLLDAAGARVARGGRLEPLGAVLAREPWDAAWTLDPRRGELAVQRR